MHLLEIRPFLDIQSRHTGNGQGRGSSADQRARNQRIRRDLSRYSLCHELGLPFTGFVERQIDQSLQSPRRVRRGLAMSHDHHSRRSPNHVQVVTDLLAAEKSQISESTHMEHFGARAVQTCRP